MSERLCGCPTFVFWRWVGSRSSRLADFFVAPVTCRRLSREGQKQPNRFASLVFEAQVSSPLISQERLSSLLVLPEPEGEAEHRH
jgi:hypothetical protein